MSDAMNTLVNQGLDLFSPSGTINELELKSYIHALVEDIFDRQLYLDVRQTTPTAIDDSKAYQTKVSPNAKSLTTLPDTK